MMRAIPFFLFALLTPSISSAIPATTTSSSSAPLPLLIWHGLGDNYAADGINAVSRLAQKVHPGTFIYPIRLDDDPGSDRTASFIGNVTLQLTHVCDAISAHPILSKAPLVDALGFSQGGQFLRGLLQRCDAVKVRSLVTFGSQHNGIAAFQACAATDWLCKGAMALLRTNTWSGFVQGRVVPAQYYRSLNVTSGLGADDYLAHSNFLADVNNEREVKTETYARRIADLENFVMYVFEDDTTVIPKESGWFAEVNRTADPPIVTPLQNRTMYEEDWLGLKKLDMKGGLVFRKIKGAHMELTDKILGDAFREYFGPVKKTGLVEQVVENWEL